MRFCFLLLIALSVPVAAYSQEVIDVTNKPLDGELDFAEQPAAKQAKPAKPAAPQVTMASDDLDDEVSEQHERTLSLVREAIDRKYENRPFKRRSLNRRLNRPAVAERVTDAVTSRALDEGLVMVTVQSGVPVVLVDWEGLADFIERLIPLIELLIGLFG